MKTNAQKAAIIADMSLRGFFCTCDLGEDGQGEHKPNCQRLVEAKKVLNDQETNWNILIEDDDLCDF